ncbi:uncharacterized protein LOC135941913 [Cloeon dipterum]|uniref:uncharacterized protein LOC135941913 n=1 Tax=Cloeon dipterum TaxID=197152 RepID=UPI0032209B58
MSQLVTFLWICGLYIGLSYVMAKLVSAYDPRRPSVGQLDPLEDDPLSRKERHVETKWCRGLSDPASGPAPVVVGPKENTWLQQALQHATGVRFAASQQATHLDRYSKSVLLLQPPELTNLADWNRLFMTWTRDFKGPILAVFESKVAAEPKGELLRVLRFLGQDTTGVKCALRSLAAPDAADVNASLQSSEVKDAWLKLLNALNETSPQLL